MFWKSVAVAPGDAMRAYAAGYQLTPAPAAHLRATVDGGQNWAELPLTDVQVGGTPLVTIGAIDPADPQRLFLISAGSNGPEGDRLYRSTDGGATFDEVLMTTQPITNVVIRDATIVLVVGGQGTFRSTDGGATFGAPAASPKLACLGERPDGTLIGCAPNWDPDFMAVGRSDDASQWQKIFRFVELAGPVACPAGTPGHDVCDQQVWPGVKAQFGASGPTCGAPMDGPATDGGDPGSGGGCCETGRSPLGAALLALLVVFRIGLPRTRRRGTRDA
jgi:hypothetical protein